MAREHPFVVWQGMSHVGNIYSQQRGQLFAIVRGIISQYCWLLSTTYSSAPRVAIGSSSVTSVSCLATREAWGKHDIGKDHPMERHGTPAEAARITEVMCCTLATPSLHEDEALHTG